MTMKRYHVGARSGSIIVSFILIVGAIGVLIACSMELFTYLEGIDLKNILKLIMVLLMVAISLGCFIASIILTVREKKALGGTQTTGTVRRINQKWTRSGKFYSLEVEFDNLNGERCTSVVPISRFTRDMYKQGENITVYVSGDYGTISKRR
jgi:hypothetical protein